jgi:hypothetical protein
LARPAYLALRLRRALLIGKRAKTVVVVADGDLAKTQSGEALTLGGPGGSIGQAQ